MARLPSPTDARFRKTNILNLPLQKCIKYDLCGTGIKEDHHYHSSIDAVCELYYGSFTQDNSQLHLSWASNDFGESNLPCSIEFMPHCIITQVRPSKKEVVSFDL